MRSGFPSIRAFPSTDWRLVFSSRPRDTVGPRDSMAELCSAYWYPVYAFLRRRGHRAEEAEDLTQGFFAHILANGLLARAQPDKGRLRSLLLASLTHFVANERDRQRARKRRGETAPPDDASDAERRYAHEPADHVTPERPY